MPLALLTLVLACSSVVLSAASGAAAELSAAISAGAPTNQFLRTWLVLGPIAVAKDGASEPGESVQKEAFAEDYLSAEGGEDKVRPVTNRDYAIGGSQLRWKRVDAKRDSIHLGSVLAATNYAVAYAWTELIVPGRTNIYLGLGSDDAIKVWVNGALVHEKWTRRALQRDDDIIPVRLMAGTNQILIKVQNVVADWGFSAGVVPGDKLVERMVQAAGQGDFDRLTDLLALRIDINAVNRAGLRAVQAAEMSGYKDIVKFLTSRGAEADTAWPLAGRLIDSLFGAIIKGESPGAAVLVAQDGRILFEDGYGLANLEHGVPITPQTKFRIGSITKQFTAAGILLLQEAGKLHVTNSLAKYVDDFPRSSEVTLHHLLTHTSGIHSYTERPDFLQAVSTEIEPAELIKLFKSDPYDFSPGEKWHYNNSGYFLLGQIIEKVSGQSYGEFLRDRIFNVAGMNASGLHKGTDIIENEASGYGYDNGTLKKALNWDMSRAGGAGALYSTVEDLYRWNEALFSGKILSPASLKAALKPVKLANGEEPSGLVGPGYGYGWITSEFRGLKQIQHGGGLHGFCSHLVRFPDEDLTVVVLANALPAAAGFDPAGLSLEIAQIYLWDRMSSRSARRMDTAVDPSNYRQYAGRYDFGLGLVLTVTTEQNGIYAQLTGQPRFEIFPRSETEFFWKVVDAQITFVTNQQGTVPKAIHKQGGNTINAVRLPEEQVAPADPATYEAYVGKYDYGQGKAIMTVTREKNQLFAQLTGQPRYEIFPKSADEFFWKMVQASVKFVKDADGKVVKAVHQQNGRTFDAPRLK